jgi:rod shape-determining protein MreC
METFLGRYRNLIVLAAVLFAQLIALAVQVRRPTDEGETRLLRVWAISAVTPLEKAVVHSQQWAQNLWTTYVYLHGVRRENRELRAEIERMKIQQARLSEDATMARRVQALLGFKEQYVESTVAAQVIGTSGSEQSRVLYIDKGSNDGIKADMAVITPTGIVGKVLQAAPSWSQVLPINDQFSGVGAALKDSRRQGILKGAPNGATTLQYIMSDEKVMPGEQVVTSGGDRIFPKGLPVGTVANVQPGKDLFLNIRVIPSAHLERVEEVLVITKITEKMPDAKELGPLRASDILAERLPGVPNKTEVDAAGNAKPADANGAAPATGAAGASGGVTGANHGASSSPPTNKPAGNAGAQAKTTTIPGTAGANKPTANNQALTTPSGAATAKPKPPVTTPRPQLAKPPSSNPDTARQGVDTPPTNGESQNDAEPKASSPGAEAAPSEAPPSTPQQGAPPQP